MRSSLETQHRLPEMEGVVALGRVRDSFKRLLVGKTSNDGTETLSPVQRRRYVAGLLARAVLRWRASLRVTVSGTLPDSLPERLDRCSVPRLSVDDAFSIGRDDASDLSFQITGVAKNE